MVLGLLLVLLSGAAVVLLAFFNRSGGPDYSVNLFDREIYIANGLSIFLTGVALALAFCLGLWLMSAGARHSRAMRAEIRSARRDARAAEAERDRLAGQVGDTQHGRHEEVPANGPGPAYARTDEPARRRFFNNRRHEDETTPTTTAH
jgi:hypothetical protein